MALFTEWLISNVAEREEKLLQAQTEGKGSWADREQAKVVLLAHRWVCVLMSAQTEGATLAHNVTTFVRQYGRFSRSRHYLRTGRHLRADRHSSMYANLTP